MLSRRIGALAVAAGALIPIPATAQDGPAERVYSFYALRATADGVVAQFRIDGFLPIEEFVGLSSVTSEANLGNTRSTSLAALPDPGDLILTLPGTLSALAGISGLPDYPAAVTADHPSQPEDELVLAPDAGLGLGRLAVTATAERASASAAVGDLRDTIGLLPSFSIGSIKTTADAVEVRPGVLEATATSTLGDIRIAGGLLRIGALTSEVSVEVVDGRFSIEASSITVSGATIAGVPIGITEDGIVGLGQPHALAPVVDLLRGPLDALGVQASTTPVTEDVGDGEATVEGAAVVVRVPLDVFGFPGAFSLRLAPVAVSVQARLADGSEGPETTDGLEPDGPSTSPVTGAPSAPGPSGSVPPATDGAPTTASPPATGDGDGTELVAMPAPRQIADWEVGRLYGWMALAGIGLLLAGPAIARLSWSAARRSDLRRFWRW